MNTMLTFLLLATVQEPQPPQPQPAPPPPPVAAPAAAGATGASGADAGVLARVERTIQKEPSYVAAPRYALFLLDAAGTARHWAVIDKSSPSGEHYDVLYFDLDGDGDLTDDGERFTTQLDPKGAAAGLGVAFRLPRIAVPSTDPPLVHEKLLLSTSPKQERTGCWFRMRWGGGVEMSGGYGLVGTSTTIWGERPASAPILWPNPDRPLSFGLWQEDPVRMRIGQATHLSFVVGSPGAGERSLCVADEHFLLPGRDILVATVVARDAAGKEVRTRNVIADHC